MTPQSDAALAKRDLFSAPAAAERFAALADPEGTEGLAILRAIAAKIGETRRPRATSNIPSGATYLAQFVIHDLDFMTREGTAEQSLLDLALIYGDGPKHDSYCYQVPSGPGKPRHLLRIGRTRPTNASPAWGASRDLPRESCPHLDAKAAETRTEVLVPNSFSDNNMLLAQTQTLWALTHNAIAGQLNESRGPAEAFRLARLINREIYAAAIRKDLLGNWLLPAFRARYADPRPRLLSVPVRRSRAPREFMAGVARLGHGLMREIYSLNGHRPVVGLRDVMRHTGTGRPDEMPLTEDWLVDFSNFFEIDSRPQMARALGPHVARPVATGAGLAAGDQPSDSIVLRDLISCTRGDLCSVRTLIARAKSADAHVFDGCFAQDESRWSGKLRDWLKSAGLAESAAARLALDPPLTLFLMLEAEHDADGKSLGALGSVLMGETLVAALPAAVTEPAFLSARSLVFPGGIPTGMADLVRFLQRHFRFPDGARLHPEDNRPAGPAPSQKSVTGVTKMLDSNPSTSKLISRIEVADHIEMGRLIARWTVDPNSRPGSVEELKEQFDGIATVPDRIKHVQFVQGTLDTLIMRLPVKEMLEESLDRMSDPMRGGEYPLPQFYHDYYNPGFGPVMTALDTLLARVGDYTIAQCR